MGKDYKFGNTNYREEGLKPAPATSMKSFGNARKVGHGAEGETVDGDCVFGSKIPEKPRPGSGFDSLDCDF